MHLADLDGDSVPDLIQCQDHAEELVPDPLSAVWTVHPLEARARRDARRFGPTGESIELLSGYPCAMELHTLDIDADSKIDLIVPSVKVSG